MGLDLAPAVDPRTVERAVYRRTNERRREHGVDPLSYCDLLAAVAPDHSRDMATRDYFDHESPDGADAGDRYRRLGHDADSVGENVALGQPGPTASVEDVARSVVDGLMDSPGHRRSVLRERYREEGIGAYTADDGRLYATQSFY